MANAKDIDPVVFDRVSKDKMEQSMMLDKQWLNINDSNNLNYSTSQIVYNTESLSSSGRWLDYADAYFSFPVFEIATSSVGAHNFTSNVAGGIRADYLLALKSGAWNLINSLEIQYNSSTIVAPNPFVNLLATYNALTTFSESDLRRINSSIFFLPETEDSWIYSGAPTSFGQGLCNNNNYPQPNPVALGESTARVYRGNSSMLERQKAEAVHQLAQANVATFNSGAADTLMNAGTQDSQYVSRQQDVATAHIKRVFCAVRLKDIHPFFANLPLLRMANLRITLNINNASFVINKTTGANGWNTGLTTAGHPLLTLQSAPTMSGGSNPLMIASCFGASALTASASASLNDVADFQITCSVSVGGVTNNAHRGLNIPALATRLYVPAYQLLPQFTSQYLALGSKKVEFLDHLCVQVSAPVGNFTQMLTPSLRGIERVVIVPHIATSDFITGGNPRFSQVSSPFCELTTAPLVGGGLNQVNVRLSGLDVIQGGGYRYGYEFFRSQMLGQGLNGGQIDGLSSGLISEKGWSRGPFQYYTIDCSRRLPENDQVTQSVELFGNNVSTVPLLLYVFVVYKREIIVDIATGAQLA